MNFSRQEFPVSRISSTSFLNFYIKEWWFVEWEKKILIDTRSGVWSERKKIGLDIGRGMRREREKENRTRYHQRSVEWKKEEISDTSGEELLVNTLKEKEWWGREAPGLDGIAAAFFKKGKRKGRANRSLAELPCNATMVSNNILTRSCIFNTSSWMMM